MRKLKKIISIFLLIAIFGGFSYVIANARVKVKGYYRKDGTYVQPHYRSDPNSNPYDNWSFPGNINPYTGKIAPGNPDTYLRNYYKDKTYTPKTYIPNISLPSFSSLSIPSYYFSSLSLIKPFLKDSLLNSYNALYINDPKILKFLKPTEIYKDSYSSKIYLKTKGRIPNIKYLKYYKEKDLIRVYNDIYLSNDIYLRWDKPKYW
ncbi:MAG: hypothetical protein AB1414_01260 [bacterium]